MWIFPCGTNKTVVAHIFVAFRTRKFPTKFFHQFRQSSRILQRKLESKYRAENGSSPPHRYTSDINRQVEVEKNNLDVFQQVSALLYPIQEITAGCPNQYEYRMCSAAHLVLSTYPFPPININFYKDIRHLYLFRGQVPLLVLKKQKERRKNRGIFRK